MATFSGCAVHRTFHASLMTAHRAALAFGIKDITREFNLTPAGTGMVASAITFGAIVGALLGGYLTDKIGRYRVFMADMVFFVVAAIA